MKKIIIASFAMATCSLLAAAPAKNKTDNIIDCAKQSTIQSSASLADCQHDRWQNSDAALNAEYQKLIKQIEKMTRESKARKDLIPFEGESIKANLVKAQRGWIQFRDADCSAKRTYLSGASGATNNYIEFLCLTLHTEQRKNDLKNWDK